MKFDINKFADRFKSTISWMLENEQGEKIKEDLRILIKNKVELNKNPDSIKALRRIVELTVTKGEHLNKPLNFDSKMESFIQKYGRNFRNSKAKDELIKLVGEDLKTKIEPIFKYSTIKDFSNHLYNLAKGGKTEVLGKKGRDNYLRDFGYWDRIPLDIHEKRFIIRTGIYHSCSSKDKSDPLEESHLQDILTHFCKKYLKGFIIEIETDENVERIDLGECPGIVDIFIWSYCAEGRYQICIKKPRCEVCNFKEVCLYAIINF